jgi:hypothetical protein
MSESENPKILSTLKNYLRSSALKDTVRETFVAYLGKNSTESDHEAFLEYIDSEYLTNECRRLDVDASIRVGVYSLLDGMATALKGRPPSLSSVLDEQAYQDGNTSTYDYYLGDRRTREEEQEFRQRLAFIRDIFDSLVDEPKAQAVAEYMLGPLKDEDTEHSTSESGSGSDSESEDDDDGEEKDPVEKKRDVKDDVEEEEDEDEEKVEDSHEERSSGSDHDHDHDHDDHNHRRHKSSKRNSRSRSRSRSNGRSHRTSATSSRRKRKY